MTRRKRSPRRLTIDFDALLVAAPEMAKHDATWCSDGFERASCRLWRCQDGTYTARTVWRRRQPGALAMTMTYVLRGIVLR
jgi:hypothetical protein